MKSTVAIIVLNWKQPQMTVSTVDQLLKLKHPRFDLKVILIDSHSPDNSLSVFHQKYDHHPQVVIIDTLVNHGTAEGNNFGIRYSLKHHFTHTLILNNDVNIDLNFLQTLLDFQKEHHCFLSSPKIYFDPGHEFHFERYQPSQRGHVLWFVGGKVDWNNVNGYHLGVDEVDHGQYNTPNFQIDFLTGCCLLINNKVFKKIGILDPYYFMYLEDIDICQRAVRAGFKLGYCPQAKIWHINAGSSGGVGSPLQDYFLTRNRLYFGLKYCSLRTKFALLRQSVKVFLASPSQWQKRGVADFYLGVKGIGSWQ